MSDLISIVITTYNSRQTLFRAIESCLNQTYTKVEIIIVNDSLDNGLGVVLKKNYPQVTYVCDGINRGGSGARMEGVKYTKGNFICFLDDDDWYLPNKLESLYTCFKECPLCYAVFGVLEGSQLKKKFCNDGFSKKIKLIPKLHTNTSLLRRSVFESVIFDVNLRKYQDTQFHLELVSCFQVCLYPITVAVWNKDQREDQVTNISCKTDLIKSLNNYKDMIFSVVNNGNVSFFHSLYLIFSLSKYSISVIFKIIFRNF